MSIDVSPKMRRKVAKIPEIYKRVIDNKDQSVHHNNHGHHNSHTSSGVNK